MADDEERIVVVVDDDPAIRRVLARVLAMRRYVVHAAEGRESGLALILEHQPDVVTVDYDLGGETTGAELARDVEAALGVHAPPLVLVSALADRVSRAERDRFAALHTKPFRAAALLDDLDRVVRRARAKSSGVLAVSARIAAKRRAENE